MLRLKEQTMASSNQLTEKFQQLSQREQLLILLVGIVAIVMVTFTLFIDPVWQNITKISQQNVQIAQKNNDTATMIADLQQHLAADPNAALKQAIAKQQLQLNNLEQALVSLTTELIDPVEMRQALSQWLKLNAGVKLKAFEVLSPEPIKLVDEQTQKQAEQANKALKKSLTNSTQSATETQLYQHGIKITVTGSYFKIRDYLQYIEQSQWKIFWHKLDYQLVRYPKSEAVVELYTLSTHKEFIGVE